jgi:aspartyl-tRNA synthetase
MLRTKTLGELRAADAGSTVTLAGWVHTRRDHGNVTFIDLRDRYGRTQIVAHATEQAAAHAALKDVRNEWVIQIKGTVRARKEGTKNPKLATGDIEVAADQVVVINESKTPPFYVNEETPVEENLRWKYRYVDLRREGPRELMRLRHEVVAFMRQYLTSRGFWEIETPTMIRSDPTGARDFVVPSRYYPGKFWALPQSPQQMKQILMVGGMDKYFQIAHCYRDEDPRADRVVEHTQLDFEMAFVEREDVMRELEGLYTEIFKKFGRKPLARTPVPRLTYEEALSRYGIDRPDLRFGMELRDLTDAVRKTSFNAFRGAIDSGGAVRGLVVPGKADATRNQIDTWNAHARTKGAKGMASFAFAGSEVRSPVGKFFTAEELATMRAASVAKDGDLLLVVADTFDVASESLGVVRERLGTELGLVDASTHQAVWITDFPLLKRTAEGGWTFAHNPFVGPLTDADSALLDSDPGRARSKQYDFDVDGKELFGGSVRIYRRDVQEKVFALMGVTKEDAQRRFGALLDALEYGAPPSGGCGAGIDRLIMSLAGTENVREVQSFPKTQTGYDPMLDAPADITDEQLKELGLRLIAPPTDRKG